MNTPKQKHFDNAMRTVFEHCADFNDCWADEALTAFCSDTNNKNALRVLADKKYLKLITTDSGNILGVTVLEDGLLYFSKKKRFFKRSLF